MKTHIKTRSGSLYSIDLDKMTWERLEETKESGTLRTDSGDLSNVPVFILGEPAILLGPPLVPMTFGRIIMTTDVVEIRQTAD